MADLPPRGRAHYRRHQSGDLRKQIEQLNTFIKRTSARGSVADTSSVGGDEGWRSTESSPPLSPRHSDVAPPPMSDAGRGGGGGGARKYASSEKSSVDARQQRAAPEVVRTDYSRPSVWRGGLLLQNTRTRASTVAFSWRELEYGVDYVELFTGHMIRRVMADQLLINGRQLRDCRKAAATLISSTWQRHYARVIAREARRHATNSGASPRPRPLPPFVSQPGGLRMPPPARGGGGGGSVRANGGSGGAPRERSRSRERERSRSRERSENGGGAAAADGRGSERRGSSGRAASMACIGERTQASAAPSQSSAGAVTSTRARPAWMLDETLAAHNARSGVGAGAVPARRPASHRGMITGAHGGGLGGGGCGGSFRSARSERVGGGSPEHAVRLQRTNSAAGRVEHVETERRVWEGQGEHSYPREYEHPREYEQQQRARSRRARERPPPQQPSAQLPPRYEEPPYPPRRASDSDGADDSGSARSDAVDGVLSSGGELSDGEWQRRARSERLTRSRSVQSASAAYGVAEGYVGAGAEPHGGARVRKGLGRADDAAAGQGLRRAASCGASLASFSARGGGSEADAEVERLHDRVAELEAIVRAAAASSPYLQSGPLASDGRPIVQVGGGAVTPQSQAPAAPGQPRSGAPPAAQRVGAAPPPDGGARPLEERAHSMYAPQHAQLLQPAAAAAAHELSRTSSMPAPHAGGHELKGVRPPTIAVPQPEAQVPGVGPGGPSGGGVDLGGDLSVSPDHSTSGLSSRFSRGLGGGGASGQQSAPPSSRQQQRGRNFSTPPSAAPTPAGDSDEPPSLSDTQEESAAKRALRELRSSPRALAAIAAALCCLVVILPGYLLLFAALRRRDGPAAGQGAGGEQGGAAGGGTGPSHGGAVAPLGGAPGPAPARPGAAPSPPSKRPPRAQHGPHPAQRVASPPPSPPALGPPTMGGGPPPGGMVGPPALPPSPPAPAAPPMMPPPAPPASFEYMGCFKDDRMHDLDVDRGADFMSTRACAVACDGYKYFGLEGDACHCGPHFSTSRRYKQLDVEECGPVCEGEEGLVPPRYCGVHDKEYMNAIYKNPSWVDATEEAAAVDAEHARAHGFGAARAPLAHSALATPLALVLALVVLAVFAQLSRRARRALQRPPSPPQLPSAEGSPSGAVTTITML